jgi:hypothetical protein
MNINKIISDKSMKPKEKLDKLCKNLLENKITIQELMEFTENVKDPIKATCIESIEFASSKVPEIVNQKCFDFIVENLTSKAPRIKWECAKIIGNTAHLFKNKLENAVKHLLENASYEGTVVRWSAALALGKIMELKTKHNENILKEIPKLLKKEDKNNIKKMYEEAIRKIK